MTAIVEYFTFSQACERRSRRGDAHDKRPHRGRPDESADAKARHRDENLRAYGRSGYTVCTTVVTPNGDCVMIVDMLAREENPR